MLQIVGILAEIGVDYRLEGDIITFKYGPNGNIPDSIKDSKGKATIADLLKIDIRRGGTGIISYRVIMKAGRVDNSEILLSVGGKDRVFSTSSGTYLNKIMVIVSRLHSGEDE